MRYDRGRDCVAEIGSVTYAMKAQRALAQAAIPSAVIKSEKSSGRRGCTYGVAFSCSQENNARAVLASARISVKQWNRDG